MAENQYPIIKLRREAKNGKRIPGRKPHFPSRISSQEQAKRLGATFNRIRELTLEAEKGIDVSTDPRAVAPERALVFELIGPVAEFEKAAEAAGLEWLLGDQCSRQEDEEEEDEEDEEASKDAATSFLYLTMPTVSGLRKLLTLWAAFSSNKQPTPEERPWWAIFGYLEDVRVWSAKDRVAPSISRYVDAILSGDPKRQVVMELDLWFRNEKEQQDRAFDTLNKMLAEVGGTLLDEVTIAEIGYQAALVSVPAHVAKNLARREGKLAEADQVMTIRPQSLYHSDGITTPTEESPDLADSHNTSSECIAALIDGYPVTAHAALAGRLNIHEADVKGHHVPVAARTHGTAMASLIIHGDLHQHQTVSGKLAVVPVLTTSPSGGETTPPGKLPIGIVYRALLALKAGVNGEPPKEPNVVVINHSICDEYAPFVRRPSPWAALLDYFSHAYRVLFVVSAGNIRHSFEIPDYLNVTALDAADDDERQAAIVLAIERAKGTRGILSPAESINSITVGALHADGAGDCPAGVRDPFPTIEMTNLCSAVGLGVNRSLKPDCVEHGGRMVALPSNGTACVSVRGHSSPHLGQLVAAPDSKSGNLHRYCRSAGTSNAAALVTRSGILVAQAVKSLYAADRINWIDLATRAVVLKALLTHSCTWGEIGEILEDSFPPQDAKAWHRRREGISRFLGYGRPAPNRIQSGADNRVTLLADDMIVPEELHEYRIPLPSAMFGTREVRRIVLTLAWSAPIAVTTANYRGVSVKIVDAAGKQSYWKGVKRITQPNASTIDKGSLVHLILEGRNVAQLATADKQGIFVGVQCRALHSRFATEKIPYALAVTLEMAESQHTKIYEEVSQAIRTRTPVRATTRTGTRV